MCLLRVLNRLADLDYNSSLSLWVSLAMSLRMPAIAPWLGIQPSFLLSGSIPALYLGAQVLVDFLPSVPFPSIHNEAPLAVLDAFTRATLLCNIVPTVVTNHVSSVVSSSPWTLLVTALVCINTCRLIDLLSSYLPLSRFFNLFISSSH